eukprot:TRINITY_DN16611_c0_g1_i2.p1 TRINITY_DN16611_c0_g1~~TRINITY_DN16611_c0_g1_i2.p1  ORF type:complete len:265 (+),score=66.67 TRINITY_DN16611_c0_g1_i2:85-879(+)
MCIRDSPMLVQVLPTSRGAGAAHSASVLAHMCGRRPLVRDELVSLGVCTTVAKLLPLGGRAATAAARLLWAMLGCVDTSGEDPGEDSVWSPVLGMAWSLDTPVELSADMTGHNRALWAMWQSGCLHECACACAVRPKHKVTRLGALAAGTIAQAAGTAEGASLCERANAIPGLLQLIGRASQQGEGASEAEEVSIEKSSMEASRALWNIASKQQPGTLPLLGHPRSVAMLMEVLRSGAGDVVAERCMRVLLKAHHHSLSELGPQ